MFNTCFRLKKQYVFSIKEKYDQTEAQFLAFEKARSSGQKGEGEFFDFIADFRFLPPLTIPSGVLENQIFEKISASGRVILLTTTLIETLQSLNSAITQRNELIQEDLSKASMNDQVTRYFRLRNSEGHLNCVYPDLVSSIYKTTDDCIFFSMMLCRDLKRHGNDLKKKLGDSVFKVKWMGSDQIEERDQFDDIKEKDLLPDENNYTDWIDKFQ